MYTPRSFRVDDSDELVGFMRHYSFCTLITPDNNELLISHVPVLVDYDGVKIILTGHLARPNPHCEALDGNRSTAIFQGPHSYISPGWYANSSEVPTWNYASVHAAGKTKTFNDVNSLSTLVDRMIDTYENQYDKPWDRKLPEDYRRQQLKHITGFRLNVEEIAGKYKLGQNRSLADQDMMLSRLEASANHDSVALARFIRRVRG